MNQGWPYNKVVEGSVMDWQRMKTAWVDKVSAIISRISAKMISSAQCCFCASDNIKQHQRPAAIKYYSLDSHSSLVGLRHIIVLEERNNNNGIHSMVVTWKDFIPPRDGGKYQNCPVRSDRTDSESQVGKFFVQKDHANTPLESGYYSAGLVTGSVVPPPSHQVHTSAGQVSIKEGGEALSSDAEADEGVDGKGEHLSQESSDTDHKREDHFADPSEPDVDAGSVTSCNGSDSNAGVSITDEDGRTASNSEFIKDKHCSASSVEEYGSARAGDDETDGHHLVPNAQGRDEDSALGFPTPASLEEVPAHDIHCVTLGNIVAVSVASGPPTALSPQHHSPSALKSSLRPPSTSLGPSSVHLQHGNSSELLQFISYTTNSFQKCATATNTKKEPQPGAVATVVKPVDKDITTPKQRDVLPTTLGTCHRHLPDVQDKPGLHNGSGDGDFMPRAVPETSAGKIKDSACVIVPRVLLPASMKAELTLRSPTSRFKEDATVGGLPSGGKLTPSPRQESKPGLKLPEGKQFQAGCIIFSSIAAFEAGSFLPLPSREAVQKSIGKGGNGTISIVYFKGAEFAMKRTHFRKMEVEILASLSHDNILPLQAVMMGEEDPQRPSRYFCYHFMPRMSGDLQSYLTKVGHGALSNLLMQHKEEPTTLQLVVDNTKHILRSILKALAYLHRNNIVHNDVKPSNFLTNTQCSCASPLICDHGQIFAVKLSDFDSALEVTKVQTRHSVLRQLYRNNPSGTPGYRPPEDLKHWHAKGLGRHSGRHYTVDRTAVLKAYPKVPHLRLYVLVATRTRDELDAGTLTAADVWGFGCSVLKIFLSHSGPHTQNQMSFLNLWDKGGPPWEVEGERAREELKLALLERVYPNWPQLWAFVSDCLKVTPQDRMQCSKLTEHPFFAS